MTELFEKVDSVILRNFHDYAKDPLINKYLGKEASEEIEGFLVLRKEKKPIWFSHPFNYSQVKKEYSSKVIVEKFSTQKELKKKLVKLLGKKVGFNARFYSVAGIKGLKKMLSGKTFIDVSVELENERRIKTKSEIKSIERAVDETKKVLTLTKKWLKKGMSEKELKKMIEDKFEIDGFASAFCIVAFGENTSHIHHVSGDKKFSGGAVLIDVGAKWNGYCADITHSWFVGNTPKEYVATESKINSCIKEIESVLKPGTSAKQLAKISSKLKMPHALGHGIGIEVHDFPTGISDKVKWILEEGMVIAIEPAIYAKKFGIRIENDYLITKNGFKRL